MPKISAKLLAFFIIFMVALGCTNSYANIVTDVTGIAITDTSKDIVSDSNGTDPSPPKITTQPANATVIAPASATFTVVATGMPVPSYQWQGEAPGTNVFVPIIGATSASYTTPATTMANSGTQYECVVTNILGALTTNAATLIVTVPTAPSIITQPVNTTVLVSAKASFSVVATGVPNPSYQWQSQAPGTSSFTAISGATSATYTTPSTTTANSGTKYECVITNSQGSVTSNVVTLTVDSTAVAPSITTQPTNAAVTAPTTATYTVVATGVPAPTYQWQSEAPGASSFTPISGATSASYTTPATTITNNGTKYECVVSNSGGTVTTTAASLSVTELAPTISLSTNSSSYAAPASINLTAAVSQTGGTISKVAFYNGSTLLATVTSSPYTYTWSNVAAGSYTLTAQATNNNGTTTTSSDVTIQVITRTVYVQNTSYNANGQITQIQYGNGTTTAYTYNPLNFRLMRIYTTNAQNVVLQDLNYTYDSLGQVLSIKDNVNSGTSSMTQTFSYDALNRLTQAQGSYGTKTYAYDVLGNITQKDGLSYTYAAAGPHAVSSLSNGTTFTYDWDGNMVSLQKGSNTTKYSYDDQNRLQSVSVGGLTAATYTYDGDGGRTEKTVYRRDVALYNDNTNLALFGNPNNTPPLPATAANTTTDTTIDVGNLYEQETDATNGSPRNTKFIYLGSTKVAEADSAGNVFYYHTDNLGGTNVLSDQTGALREFTFYDPFGQVLVHEKYGNTFATAWYYFTGKPLDDETGLIFLGARYYNPSLGRFITPDTIVQAPENPQTLNRYTYCNNNPVNLVDPTGHSWWKKFWHSISGVVSWLLGGVLLHSQVQQALSGGSWVPLIVQGAALAASFFLPIVGELSGSIFLNVLGHIAIGAAEGAIIGGLSSVALGGNFGQGAAMGAIGGAIGGAIQGITTSEQFQNLQAGYGFKSNTDTYKLSVITQEMNNDTASASTVANDAANITTATNNSGNVIGRTIAHGTADLGIQQTPLQSFLNTNMGNTNGWMQGAEIAKVVGGGALALTAFPVAGAEIAYGGIAFSYGIANAATGAAMFANSASNGSSLYDSFEEYETAERYESASEGAVEAGADVLEQMGGGE